MEQVKLVLDHLQEVRKVASLFLRGGGNVLINLAHARGIYVVKPVIPAMLSVIFSPMLIYPHQIPIKCTIGMSF